MSGFKKESVTIPMDYNGFYGDVLPGSVDIIVQNIEEKGEFQEVGYETCNTPNIAKVVKRVRDAFERGVTKPISWRKKQLNSVLKMLEENRSVIIETVQKDLRRHKLETNLVEVDYMINTIKDTVRDLDDWVKPEYPPKAILYLLNGIIIYKEPYGVVLVIGTWNYPIQLLLTPMLGAIAAGNAVIVKPSEVADASAKFIAKTLPKYVDNDAVIVIEGGPEEMTELLKQKFDYIFFTGSTNIGKIVHAAAAKHLTPVTLELGGKCPVYIDDAVDLTITAKRILWCKLINCGQTCIAPDYILCSKEVQEKFVKVFRQVVEEWYGNDIENNLDFGRIINDRHFGRLLSMINANKSKIAVGGNYNAASKYIAPTLIVNVTDNDKVMEDEIFGPILAVMTVENPEEAIKIINKKSEPLVVHLFSSQSKIRKMFIEQTRSGSLSINEAMFFSVVDSLPFGGFGQSGIGAYHGKATFDTFTHRRSCFHKRFIGIEEMVGSLRYPPYNKTKAVLLTLMMKMQYSMSLKYLPHIIFFAIGAGVSYAYTTYKKDDM